MYRRRLVAGGVSRQNYEQGGSLSAARGHAATPDRPVRVSVLERNQRRAAGSALNDPQRYADYLVRRYPRIVHKGQAPRLLNGWVEYRDSTFHRAATYIDAIGNPAYIQVWIQSDGLVVTQVDRGRR